MASKPTSIAGDSNVRYAHRGSRVSAILIAKAKYARAAFVQLRRVAMAPRTAKRRMPIVAALIAYRANLAFLVKQESIASVAFAWATSAKSQHARTWFKMATKAISIAVERCASLAPSVVCATMNSIVRAILVAFLIHHFPDTANPKQLFAKRPFAAKSASDVYRRFVSDLRNFGNISLILAPKATAEGSRKRT